MIVVGLSACLTGQVVRYDGKSKYSRVCMDELSKVFEFRAFCPEVAIGMGVPRAPIRLLEDNGQVKAVGVNDSCFDVTSNLREYAQSLSNQMAAISGYIFTERSPSCGLGSTKLHSLEGLVIGTRSGIFAQELRMLWPKLPMVEAECLEEESARVDFIQQVLTYHQSIA